MIKPATPSLEDEYRALAAQVREQRERADRLRALADRLEDNAARDEHLLRELAAVLGRDPQLRLEDLDERLRGQRLREVAIEVLRREVGSRRANPLPRVVRATRAGSRSSRWRPRPDCHLPRPGPSLRPGRAHRTAHGSLPPRRLSRHPGDR